MPRTTSYGGANMHFKRKENKTIGDINFEFDSMEDKRFDMIGSLTENELEFLKMKKMRTKAYTPDPRLGDYET
jgi:hypothetical protein